MPCQIPPPTAPMAKAPPKSLRMTHGLCLGFAINLWEEGANTKKMRTKDPGCDLRVPWGKGSNNKRWKSEKKGVSMTRWLYSTMTSESEKAKPAEIFRLGPAYDHVDEGRGLMTRDVWSINSNWESTETRGENTTRWFISNHYHPMSVRPSSAHAQRVPLTSSRRSNPQEVYVLVPRSPYSLSTSEPIGARTTDSPHNPPTPLRAYNMPNASPLTIIKRKRSEGNFGETEQRAPETKSKRPKVSTTTSKAQGATKPSRPTASNATAEFPNGFFYCHQCNKKRDSSGEPGLALIMRPVINLNPIRSRTILHL